MENLKMFIVAFQEETGRHPDDVLKEDLGDFCKVLHHSHELKRLFNAAIRDID